MQQQTPKGQLRESQQQLAFLQRNLQTQMTQLFLNKQKQFTSAVQQLDLLSPLKIMGRGYSYTTKEDRVVKTVTELQPADQLTIHYADGTVQANVETITAKKRSFNMPKKRKTFEESLNALEEIVQRLERGDVPWKKP